MTYVNRATVWGNLGADPVVRKFPDGTSVAVVSVASTERWRDRKTNEDKEHTEWHRVVFYRGLAEVVGKHLKKGSGVYVEGKLRTRQWEDNGQTRYITEIVAAAMRMLGGKPEDGNAAGAAPEPSDSMHNNVPLSSPVGSDVDASDIPF